MKKWAIIQRITEAGLVAVVRAQDAEQARRITDACREGGVAAIEITYTVPGATQVIEALAKTGDKGIILGAGTVLDSETARIAILAGAEYIVSPSFDAETAFLCNRYQVPYMPGVTTLTEAVRAMSHGADILKVFPGELFGPKIIKSYKGPLPQANMMPTGGVSVDNVGEWIKAGACAVGAGSSLTAPAKTGDYTGITTLAKQFMEQIKAARQ